MTESKAGARPSQVTMAAGVAAVGSALLVLTLFDSISNVRSIEVREGIEKFLTTPPGDGLGLTVPAAVEILRSLMLVTGAFAAAATVLAIYVFQRNKSARIGYTVSAVVIMLTAPVSGSFLPVMIAFAAMMMWSKPARDWFSGTAAVPVQKDQRGTALSSEKPDNAEIPSSGDAGAPEWPRMPDSSSDRPVPPPTQGFGSPDQSDPQQGSHPEQAGSHPQGQPGPESQSQPSQSWAPAHGQQQYGGQPGYGQPRDPEKRPTTVTIAAWLTWGFSALTLLAFGMVVLVMLAARDQLLDALESDPNFASLDLATDEVMAVLWVMSAVVLFWCAASIALAVLAYRRMNWARITLVVSASVALLFSLAAFPVGLLHALAAGATIALLFVGGANQWYSRKGGTPGSYASYPGPAQYGGQPPQQNEPSIGEQKDPPTNVW